MNEASPVRPFLVESFRLLPVIEIEPFPYQTEGRESHSGLGGDDPAAWDAYWRDSLADSRITDLVPIREHSWLVATSSFTDSNHDMLHKVLSVRWKHHKEIPSDVS